MDHPPDGVAAALAGLSISTQTGTTLTSPPLALHLPTELTLSIFHRVLLPISQSSTKYSEAVQVLRDVHTIWADIIDDYPNFWTTLRCADSMQVVQASVVRSKTAALDVVIRCYEGSRGNGHSLEDHRFFLLAAGRAANRWHGLDLAVFPSHLNEFAPYVLQSLPTLHTLRLHLIGASGPHDWVLRPTTAPNLRVVSLNRARLAWTADDLPTVTRLDIRDLDFGGVSDVLAIVGKCPGLQTLVVYRCTFSNITDFVPVVSPSIFLTGLRTLALRELKASNVDRMLGTISPPPQLSILLVDSGMDIDADRSLARYHPWVSVLSIDEDVPERVDSLFSLRGTVVSLENRLRVHLIQFEVLRTLDQGLHEAWLRMLDQIQAGVRDGIRTLHFCVVDWRDDVGRTLSGLANTFHSITTLDLTHTGAADGSWSGLTDSHWRSSNRKVLGALIQTPRLLPLLTKIIFTDLRGIDQQLDTFLEIRVRMESPITNVHITDGRTPGRSNFEWKWADTLTFGDPPAYAQAVLLEGST